MAFYAVHEKPRPFSNQLRRPDWPIRDINHNHTQCRKLCAAFVSFGWVLSRFYYFSFFFLFSEWRHESTFCFRQFNPSETVGGWCFFVCVLFICQGWWLFLGNYGDECIAHISVVLVVSSAFERLRHAYVRYVDMRGAFLRMWSGAMRWEWI